MYFIGYPLGIISLIAASYLLIWSRSSASCSSKHKTFFITVWRCHLLKCHMEADIVGKVPIKVNHKPRTMLHFHNLAAACWCVNASTPCKLNKSVHIIYNGIDDQLICWIYYFSRYTYIVRLHSFNNTFLCVFQQYKFKKCLIWYRNIGSNPYVLTEIYTNGIYIFRSYTHRPGVEKESLRLAIKQISRELSTIFKEYICYLYCIHYQKKVLKSRTVV